MDAMGTDWRDQFGQSWVPIQVDHLAGESNVACVGCEEISTEGWLCLDGGQELCSDHITVAPDWFVEKLHQEQRESMLHANRMIGMFSEIKQAIAVIA
jgi:hypothetical protein